jgi:hypothetical protein
LTESADKFGLPNVFCKLYIFKKAICNAKDVLDCLNNCISRVNIQKRASNLKEIIYFVFLMPEYTEVNVRHEYAKVIGILSYYNFFNSAPDFTIIKTRIFSGNSRLVSVLAATYSSIVLPYSKTGKTPLMTIGKIKDVKYIRKKRLFIKHKERIAISLLNPLSNLFYLKINPDVNTAPIYCKYNKKGNILMCLFIL